MAHPDHCGFTGGEPLQQGGADPRGLQVSVTKLSLTSSNYFAAQKVSDELHSVADSEDRHAQTQHFGRQLRGALCIDRRRTTREDKSCDVSSFGCVRRLTVGPHLAVDVLLTDTPSDQLGVLGAEVQDQNLAALVHWNHSEGRDSTVRP